MIFVTGATGLLGSHLLVELSKADVPIRALKRSTSDLSEVQQIFNFYFGEEGPKKFEKIHWTIGDITDIVSLEEGMKGCSVVYHAAAMVSFVKRDFKKMMEINKRGTANVVNLALSLKIDHLVYISSVAALGRDGRKDFYDETNKWKNTPENSGYAITKFAAENEVWRGIEEGLPAAILNPTIILGPGNWNEGSISFFKVLSKGMSFYPPGENGFVDARDVAKLAVMLSEKRLFNERFLTVGENNSFFNLFSKIAQYFNKKSPRNKLRPWMLNLAWRIDGVLSFFGKSRSVTKENSKSSLSTSKYSNQKIKNKLNFSFYSLDEMIVNAGEYFKTYKV